MHTGRLEGGQFMSTQGGWRVDSSCAYREVGGWTVHEHTGRLEGGQFICIQGGWRVDSSCVHRQVEITPSTFQLQHMQMLIHSSTLHYLCRPGIHFPKVSVLCLETSLV